MRTSLPYSMYYHETACDIYGNLFCTIGTVPAGQPTQPILLVGDTKTSSSNIIWYIQTPANMTLGNHNGFVRLVDGRFLKVESSLAHLLISTSFTSAYFIKT